MLYAVAKRAFDLAAASSALLLLSPVLLLVMVILRLTGEGEVFYVQERIGRQGQRFGLFKFVTMRKDSPKYGAVTVQGDPRVLPVGRTLRAWKINELPQLLNVVRGEMSIVGPRPLVEETFSCYPAAVQATVLEMKPGLTGLGSLVFRSEEAVLGASPKPRMTCYREDIAPLKGALEEWYFARRSFALDLKLVLATALSVVSPKGRFYLRWFAIDGLLEGSSLARLFAA